MEVADLVVETVKNKIKLLMDINILRRKKMTLNEGKRGFCYEVKKIHLEEKVSRRLGAMGVNEKTRISILNKKGNGALVIMVRGTRLAIGKELAGGIEIYEQNN